MGTPFYQLPPKRTLQALWPCQPETFPVHLEFYNARVPISEIHLALYCHYQQTMLGYAISDGGHKAWVFYKWVHSAIDKVVNQHDFHSIFQYEPAAPPSGWPTATIITSDELHTELNTLPLIQPHNLHIQFTKI